MPVYVTDKATINNRIGGLSQQIDRSMLAIQQFKAWMDSLSDATLISTYGYVQADLDVIRSAVADLDQLRTIYQGAVGLASPKDFRTFDKLLYPFGSI